MTLLFLLQLWYDADTFKQYEGGQSIYLHVNLEKVNIPTGI